MGKQKKTNNIIGLRIAEVRKKHKLTQAQFAAALSDYINRDTILSTVAISSWETGRQLPNTNMLTAIASYFGVSVGYLTGTEYRDGEVKQAPLVGQSAYEEKQALKEGNYHFQNMDAVKILEDDLPRYDGRPVFISFIGYQHEGLWGILDYMQQKLITIKGTYKLDLRAMDLYPLESYDFPTRRKRYAHPLSVGRFQNMKEKFWVEVKTPDQEIRNRYNGWYVHDKEHTAIVNLGTGLLLPYVGFGISYDAYQDPHDVVIDIAPAIKYPKKDKNETMEDN